MAEEVNWTPFYAMASKLFQKESRKLKDEESQGWCGMLAHFGVLWGLKGVV